MVVEEKMAIQFINKNPKRKFILAPHDVSKITSIK